MNALNELVTTAGQKVHERLYEATWIWNGHEFPCTQTDLTTNPRLILGGYSPDTEVMVTIRGELFGDGPYPVKDQICYLRPKPGGTVIALRVGTIETSIGEVIQKIHCTSADQHA